MIVALPLHVVAIVVWLGGLFALTVLGPNLPEEPKALWWHRSLDRFVVVGSLALGVIITTGIALVQLRFGGFSKMPALHRWNMLLGVPAIVLYSYVYIVRWRSLRRAVAQQDWRRASEGASVIRVFVAVTVALGLAASIVSLVGRVLEV